MWDANGIQGFEQCFAPIAEIRHWVFEPDNKRKGAPLVVRVNMSWVTTTKYHTKQGWVELTWNHKLVPHLLGLKREFTSYKLNQMAALRSVYSHRLLELLMMFECTGWAKFSLDDFCQSMQATPTQRKTLRIFAEKSLSQQSKNCAKKMAGKLNTKPSKQGEKLQAYTLLLNATSKKICFKYSSWIFEILKNSWGDPRSLSAKKHQKPAKIQITLEAPKNGAFLFLCKRNAEACITKQKLRQWKTVIFKFSRDF